MTPLLGELAVNSFRLAERQGDFETFGVYRHMAKSAKAQAQNDEGDHCKARALSAPTKVQQSGCHRG